MDWWNANYSIRKNIKISNSLANPIAEDSPIYIQIDFTKLILQNKVREDFEDIEIAYWNSLSATPSWIHLAREIEYDGVTGQITVIFNCQKTIGIGGIEVDYYVYMCNPRLRNQPTRPAYVSSEYSQLATPSIGGVTFTRPTEDWKNGISLVDNARAAFSFYGKKAKINLGYGPDRGIVELRVDDSDPVFIDTFSTLEQTILAYTTIDLQVEKHYVRLRVTGDKNPTAIDSIIELKTIEFSRYVEAEVILLEEIYSTNEPVRTMLGS